MRSSTLLFSGLLALAPPTLAHADDPRCDGLGGHRDDTVIVLDSSGESTICRHGSQQPDVVTGRPVWVVLRPDATQSLYEFRLAENAADSGPSGLGIWQERAAAAARALGHLADSTQAISEIPPAPSAIDPKRRALATARQLYLGVGTPRFNEALRALTESDLDQLPEIAGAIRRWCAPLRKEGDVSPDITAGLGASCDNHVLDKDAVARQVQQLEQAIKTFHARRSIARDALLQAEALPDDAARQEEGRRALDESRAAVVEVTDAAERLRPVARALSRDATLLREAVHSRGLLRPGVPVFLASYGRSGNGILRLTVRPTGLILAGVDAATSDTHTLTVHFSIVDTHYIDLEAGLGITGGLPLAPTVASQNGMVTLQGKSVDEFVALALVELEPARFIWPDRPLAGLLRFPVIGIPLSVNPTENFFIGGGLGWTGVGSITAGPYLARELSLASGYSLGQTLPASTSFSAITRPGVQVGYYVSISVDLVGLFHLFVPVHLPTVDASTGKAL